MLAVAVVSCTDDDEPDVGVTDGLVTNLIRSMDFPDGMILSGFPDPMGQDSMILPIGGPVLVEPESGGIMPIEIDDEEDRPVAATLIQFVDSGTREGAGEYIRVPVDDEQQQSNVIDNPFSAGEDVCEGVCSGLYLVSVINAIEFENGDVTSTVERDMLVDCRDAGDPNACDDIEPGAGGGDGDGGSPASDGPVLIEGALLCGSVENQEPLFTGNPQVDGHLDAVVRLSVATDSIADDIEIALGEMSALLQADSSAPATVASELAASLEANTEAGLAVQLAQLGCGVRSAAVRGALARCDQEAAEQFAGTECPGECRLDKIASSCPGDADGSCRGLGEAVECEGECTGACTDELESPGVCAGTCAGSCSGACPQDDDGDCLGPCQGDCTGSCRVAVAALSCGGECTGLCAASMDDGDECPVGSVRYCMPQDGDVVECDGACFDEATLASAADECGVVPIAMGRIYPLCEPTLVQVSFAFAGGLDADEEMEFAELADGLNSPLRRLYENVERIDLLVTAGGDVLDGLNDEVATAIDDGDDDDAALTCAMEQLPAAIDSIEEDLSRLASIQEDAMTVLSEISVL